MPIVVDPLVANPPPQTSVSSPDGILTATADSAYAGVLLMASFGDQIQRTNLSTNPRFGTDTDQWIASSFGSPVLSRVATGGPAGSPTFGRITWGGSSGVVSGGFIYGAVDQVLSCGTGDVLSGSVWVRCSKTQRVMVRTSYRDDEDTALVFADSTPVVLTANTWTELTLNNSTVAPAGTVEADVNVTSVAGTSGTEWAAADTLDATLLLVVNADTAGTYFDGSFATATYHYRWTGTADGSTSEEYIPRPDLTRVPYQVRFERDGLPVRSGDPAWSPGGFAVAYDHEVPLGVAGVWTAVPVYRDGTEGDPSQSVALVVPAPAVGFAWVKSISDPTLSLLLEAIVTAGEPEYGYDDRINLQQVPGSSYVRGTWDVMVQTPVEYVFRTNTVEQKDAWWSLIRSGTLLVQISNEVGIADLFCLPTAPRQRFFLGSWDPRMNMSVTLVPQARPTTIDAPLIIPGRSYDDHRALGGTYTVRTAAWPTYDDHLVVAVSEGLIDESGGGDDEGSP